MFRHYLVQRTCFSFLFSFALLLSLIDRFSLSLFSFLFFCFLSLVFLLFVFFFCFSFFSVLSWRTPLTQDNRSFVWKTLLLSHPRVRLEISILGQGYGKKLMFGSKGLQMTGHNVFADICLANGSERRECPNHFHEMHIMIIRNSSKISHSTYPCGHSNIRLCGHTNTKA